MTLSLSSSFPLLLLLLLVVVVVVVSTVIPSSWKSYEAFRAQKVAYLGNFFYIFGYTVNLRNCINLAYSDASFIMRTQYGVGH